VAVRVLVTGGTGFVGGAVVRELLARGHAVRALVRASSDAGDLAAAGVEVVRGELLDAAGLRRALAGCEGVIHCAGKVSYRPGAAAELRAVNVEAVEAVLGAALEVGVGRAVLTSSTSALGASRTPVVLDPDAPGNAESLDIPYFTTKALGERAGLALAGRGLSLAVVRPSFCLGPGDVHGSSAALVVSLARRRLPGYVEGGTSFCDVREVARAHAEALERGRAGAVYTLGGHNVTTTELVTRVCRLAGVAPPRRLPYSAALAIASAEEITAGLQRRAPHLTRDLVRASALYTWTSAERAQAELGWRLPPLEDMVRDTFRWAIARGKLPPQTDALRALG
jgi:dihydroflavonol-4-reductase